MARKDALAELRGRHATVSTLFFAAVVLLLFGFALGPDRPTGRRGTRPPVAGDRLRRDPGGRSLHQLETDDGALEHLAAYPVDRRALYAGKALGGFAVMLVLGLVLLVAVAILFAVEVASAPIPLLVTIVLGAAGVAAVGTFYAGLTVRLRAREVMLPLLMLPILAPLLLAAVKATAAALSGDPFGELGAWIGLLVAFDIVMIAAGAATYGFLLEDG